jgi:predicted nucleic acid-binding protein
VILIDAGPLVAVTRRDDPYHATCVRALAGISNQTVYSTWPCITEALYLVRRYSGFAGQEPLWQLLLTGRVELVDLTSSGLQQCYDLMRKYSDTPMSFAEASLIIAATMRGISRVFTLDQGFRIFRLPDGSVLDIIP